jgi:hypothetical protein
MEASPPAPSWGWNSANSPGWPGSTSRRLAAEVLAGLKRLPSSLSRICAQRQFCLKVFD